MKQPRRNLIATAGCALLAGALVMPSLVLGQTDILPPVTPARPAAPAAPAAPAYAAPAPAAPAAAAPVATRPANTDDAAIIALSAEVLQQQAKLAENQKTIDEKLAVIAENLRIARIYVSRVK